MLSKKRYEQIRDIIAAMNVESDVARQATEAIAQLLGYDPLKSTYDPEKYQRNKQKVKEHYDRWIERKAEKGESIRPAGYYAAYYQRNKEYLKQKRLERKAATTAAI